MDLPSILDWRPVCPSSLIVLGQKLGLEALALQVRGLGLPARLVLKPTLQQNGLYVYSALHAKKRQLVDALLLQYQHFQPIFSIRSVK